MSRTRPEPVVSSGVKVVADERPSREEYNVAASSQPAQGRTIRHAHLYLTRLDPWSVMKNAFMLSIAIAIVMVVATLVLWLMLTASGTLTALTNTVNDIAGSGSSAVDLAGLLSFSRVMGITAMIALMEVVLVSALATLFAYLYNLAVGLTGGLQVTLTEDN